MKAMRGFLLIVAMAMGVSTTAHAQAFLNQVRLDSAITATDQTQITLTVADGISVGHVLYIDVEALVATAVNTTTEVVTVARGQLGTAASTHLDDSLVWTGVATRFYFVDPPAGRCMSTSAYPGGAKPWINVLSGAFYYCDDDTYGEAATAGYWRSPGTTTDKLGRVAYTAIAYRTSRTSTATVVTPALTVYPWDTLIASLTYSGPFEVFLPAPTGLLGKRITVSDFARLNTNSSTSTAGRTISIRGLFENGDNTVTLARFQEPAGGGISGETPLLVGIGAATSFYVGITATSGYYWFTSPW